MEIRIDGGSEVAEYCKRKIADFLGTVECSETPRDKCDWYAACNILENNPELVALCIQRLIEDLQAKIFHGSSVIEVKVDYETFDRVCGRVLWENFRHMRRDLPRPPYGNIIFD